MSLLPLAVVLAVGGALIAGLRVRDRRRRDQVRAERAAENSATFQNECVARGISGPVAAVVYDFFAREDVLVEVAPRMSDRLWKDQGIDYPGELAEVLTTLVARLGRPERVQSAQVIELRSVGDVATWLQQRLDISQRTE